MTSIGDYLNRVRCAGGFKKYGQKKQEKKEKERIKNAYLDGLLTREELPRIEDGVGTFEFNEEMGLYTEYGVGSIIYIENEYSESLNDFFIRNESLRLYKMYKFVYLPNSYKESLSKEFIRYFYPEVSDCSDINLPIDSSYPLNFLRFPEDANNIKHGMIFFRKTCDYGLHYIRGYYYPLEEGDDEYITKQLDDIVKNVHSDSGGGALYSRASKPEIEEGSTDEYADELFPWVLIDNEAAVLVKEIIERIAALKEKGIEEQILFKIFQKEPKLSRLIITKDMRICLPDYNDMEIKMEPINKAVYLLFLRHPEGILFKHLPDYRKELAEIYEMIKPYGLNERAIKSIEDVTNPCLNSINEKCARIRGAFISRFNEKIAMNYYIRGYRGEEKKISLPRDLVTWETE